ncbi:carbohydrate ABC transporter permease [Falsiroseomonas sp. HW251]|uniref:carbohydrate ABC transporter permease n=1 Tax=Falsiroseomonas sp. HW251 TaxID=3390998 RepID=UPI003D318403
MRRTRLRPGAAVAAYGAVLLACAFALLPVLWGLSTSLKTTQEVHAWPPSWLPVAPTFDNWRLAVFDARFMRYVGNTLLVVAGSLVLSLGLALLAAWATVRFRFRGREGLLLLMWSTIMVPGIAVVVPLYAVAVEVGIYDTLLAPGLVFSAWLVPTLVWLLRGFIAAVPAELEESAQIDGCTPLGAFARVTVPLLWPGLVAGSILVFVMIWNDFLIAYSLTLSDENRLVQVGIYAFMTETGVEYGPLCAAAIASIIPIVALYAALQRYFIQGLTGGAVKG